MTTVRHRLTSIRPETGRAAAQLVGATLGAMIIGGSAIWFLFIFATMSRGESGFAEGLVLLLGGLYVLFGFVVLAGALAIPQRQGEGIHFTRRQRAGLIYGTIAPIASVLAIPVGATLLPPLPAPVHTALVAVVIVFVLSGPIVTLLVLARRLAKGHLRPA